MHKTLSLGYISRAGMEDCKKKIFFLAKNGGLCTKGVIHTGGGGGGGGEPSDHAPTPSLVPCDPDPEYFQTTYMRTDTAQTDAQTHGFD